MRIPAVITVDVEPDGIFIDPAKPLPWRGFESASECLGAWRRRFSAATANPAHYTWLLRMDPQIEKTYGRADWAARRYSSFFRVFEKEGDEVGLHTHAFRWEEREKVWVIDHGNPDWVAYCLRSSFRIFEGAFGRRCDSFRFGERWMGDEAFELLERLGARFDLTVEPGHPAVPTLRPARFTGAIPDYTAVPHQPYRPRKGNFREPDFLKSGGIWVIPTSALTMRHELSRMRRLYCRLFDPRRLRPVHLTLFLNLDPGFFRRIVVHLMEMLEKPFLVVKVRTDSFSDPAARRNIEENLQMLLRLSAAGGVVFSTPAELLGILGLSVSQPFPHVLSQEREPQEEVV